MNKNKHNIPDDFDPSPFKNSKDDLDHALEDIRIATEHFSKIVKVFTNLQMFSKHFKEKGYDFPSQNEMPLLFIRIHEDSINDEYPERSIFAAMLNRSNKDMTLNFAYDWLVGQGMIQPMILRNEFISKFWSEHFENIII